MSFVSAATPLSVHDQSFALQSPRVCTSRNQAKDFRF